MEPIIKILLDIVVNREEYKLEDPLDKKLKELILKLSGDEASKAMLEKVGASTDQASISQFLA